MSDEWLFLDIYKWRHSISLFCKETLHFIPTEDQAQFLDDMTDLSEERALIMSPRGAGKTKAVSALATWTVSVLSDCLDRRFEACILAGSAEQADEAYRFCKEFFYNHPYLRAKLKDEPTKTITLLRDGSFIKRLTTSSKSVMGKHVDLLILDEPADVPDELILEAFPIVETSLYPRIVMCGVPKNYLHLFVQIWKEPDVWGFKVYNWDLSKCHFRPRVQEEIERARMTYDEERFAIHYLGRPYPKIGTVFPQRELADCRVRDKLSRLNDKPVYMGIDWGYESPTAITILQEQLDGIAILYAKEFKRPTMEEIHRMIEQLVSEYRVTAIYADSTWKGENQRLRDNPQLGRVYVREIPFKSTKNVMIGQLRKMIKDKQLLIPLEYTSLIHQLADYRYDTRRGDDLVDSTMLAIHALMKHRVTRPARIILGKRRKSRLLPREEILRRSGIYT